MYTSSTASHYKTGVITTTYTWHSLCNKYIATTSLRRRRRLSLKTLIVKDTKVNITKVNQLKELGYKLGFTVVVIITAKKIIY